jgi:hypothetical protein
MRCARPCRMALPLLVWLAFTTSLFAQEKLSLSEEQMKEFLLKAQVTSERTTPKGITAPIRLTLTDGKITHDAVFQRVDEYKAMMEFANGTREPNFKDSYKFNLAAYELAKMLGLGDMMPVTVERKIKGQTGALSWYLPSKMDEATRLAKKISPPDVAAWNRQMYKKRIFAELVYDTDPNLTNVLISEDWRLWMIDFTRAFRNYKEVRLPKNILESKCERKLLERLRALDRNELKQRAGAYLNDNEITGVMGRRDKIVKMYEDLVAKKGEKEVLYDDPEIR